MRLPRVAPPGSLSAALMFCALALAHAAAAQTTPPAADTTWFDDHIRRIHMDFHTLEVHPETVIKNFDAERYVGVLADAHVNSLVSFAKDHHGNSYYDTELGHKHSGLPEGTDMLGEIIAAGHARDMRILAYFSVGWLTPVERAHPEWMERNAAGEIIGTGNTPKPDSWNNICLNSPYLEQTVLPELTELCGAYAMDGLWIDIVENNPCYCQWCRAAYADAHDGAAAYPSEEAAREFAAETRYRAVGEMVGAAKAANPDLLVSYNTAGRDPKTLELVDFGSIETHPGATWHQGAWTHALLTMKVLQAAGLPWESTTSRFIHGWGGWDDQTEANMLAVAARIAANGGVINLGDQTYPDGTLDAALYEKIGRVFGVIEDRERWAIGADSYPEIAVALSPTQPFDIYSIYGEDPAQLDPYLGAAKILTDRHWNWDVVHLDGSDALDRYRAVVLPEVGALDSASSARLEAYVRAGGKVLATGNASLDSAGGAPALAPWLGATYVGESPYSVGYLDVDTAIAQDLRRSPLLVPAPFFDVAPAAGAEVLARQIRPLIEPRPEELFFFRNGKLSPPGEPAPGAAAAITHHHHGEGQVVYAAAPLFGTYVRESQWYLKDVVANLLGALEVEHAVELRAPQTVEMYVRTKGDRLVVNLVNYALHAETNQVEEVLPVHDVELRIPAATLGGADALARAAERVEVIGADGEVRVRAEGDVLAVTLPRVDQYVQVVLGR